jgi:hypothetical protein
LLAIPACGGDLGINGGRGELVQPFAFGAYWMSYSQSGGGARIFT